MRKDTKKQLMALGIVLIFGMSSIAFFFTSFFGGITNDQSQDIEPLDRFVIDGQVDGRVEDAYYRSGFTWIKVYYADKNEKLYTLVEQLPDMFKTPDGQTQLVVQRLHDNSTFISAYSVNGEEEFTGQDENEIISKLCSIVVLPPADCAFLNQTSTI